MVDSIRILRNAKKPPHELAKLLDCPVVVVSAAFKGDATAWLSLLDGSASRTGKRFKVSPPLVYAKDSDGKTVIIQPYQP